MATDHFVRHVSVAGFVFLLMLISPLVRGEDALQAADATGRFVVEQNAVEDGDFETCGQTGELPANWTVTPDGAWSIDRSSPFQGAACLSVQPVAGQDRTFYIAQTTIAAEHLAGQRVRCGGWVKVEGLEFQQLYPNVRIRISGDGIDSEAVTFRPDSPYSYLEQTVDLPASAKTVKLELLCHVPYGRVWIDDLLLTSAATSPRWEQARIAGEESTPWLAQRTFRLRGRFDDMADDQPAWADVDFARMLWLDGERNPMDPGSLAVFAVMPDGSSLRCAASYDDALTTLGEQYDHNGTIKWRTVAGAACYELYFDPANRQGSSPQAGSAHLGVGELLHYASDQRNTLWGGWVGTRLEVLDVDDDGDLDVYTYPAHGGVWLCRNIGSQQSPVFLPRARAMDSDRLPPMRRVQPPIDFNGDDSHDKLIPVRQPLGTGQYTDGVATSLRVQLSDSDHSVPLLDTEGHEVRFENSAWFEAQFLDLDNDGRFDIIVGTAEGYAEALLNRGLHDGQPTVEHTRLAFDRFSFDPTLSGDMSLKFAPVDWDGDGATDLVLTGWSGYVGWMRNKGLQGKLAFEPCQAFEQRGGLVVSGADSPTPCVTDWDGDGDVDMIAGNCNGLLTLFENISDTDVPAFKAGVTVRNESGDPIYVASFMGERPPVQGPSERFWGYLSCVAWDVDHDGDLDLILNDALGRLRWIENVGTRRQPSLAASIQPFCYKDQPLLSPWRNRPGVMDADGDGQLELIVLNLRGEVCRYVQDADDPSQLASCQVLTDADGQPLVPNPNYPEPRSAGRSQFEVGDWDGDGDWDLIIGRPRFQLGFGAMLLCENVGSNESQAFAMDYLRARGYRFAEWMGYDGHTSRHSISPSIVDWNHDGSNDLLIGVESGGISFYAHDYFEGDRFAVWQPTLFEKKTATLSIVLLDFADRDNPAVRALSPDGRPLQYEPKELRLNSLLERGIELSIPRLADGDTVHGPVKFEARVDQPVVVKQIDFFVDDQYLATERGAPYVAFGDDRTWDSTTVANGRHTLRATALLYNGKTITQSVTINVAN